MKSVSILLVGDELLRGEIRDANGPYALRAFAMAGLAIARVVIVHDLEDEIVDEVKRMRPLGDGVVISGGVGPTHDDRTRQALSRALGRPLVVHAEALRRIEGFFGDKTTDAERSMAMLPEGSTLWVGPITGTLGLEVERCFAFPGVPALFRDLVDAVADRHAATPPTCCNVYLDRREGEVATILDSLQANNSHVSIGSYPEFDGQSWRLRVSIRAAKSVDAEQVARELREVTNP